MTTQNSITIIPILQKLSRYTNRKPIGSRLAFQAKESNKNKHTFALKIPDSLDHKKVYYEIKFPKQ